MADAQITGIKVLPLATNNIQPEGGDRHTKWSLGHNPFMSKPREQQPVDFSQFIFKVLRKLLPDGQKMNLTKCGKTVINSFVLDMISVLSYELRSLLHFEVDRYLITVRDVEAAVRFVFGPKLAEHAVSQGIKRVECYNNYVPIKPESGKNNGSSSRSIKAGLLFPVAKVEKEVNKRIPERMEKDSCIYFTAVLEYLTAELLDLSWRAALDTGSKKIDPRCIMLAARCDDELRTLFKSVDIAKSGVMPNVRRVLHEKTLISRDQIH